MLSKHLFCKEIFSHCILIDSTPGIRFSSADQKWTPRGKMGAAILSTDNTLFQLILYKNKTQPEVSTRITTSTVITVKNMNFFCRRLRMSMF